MKFGHLKFGRMKYEHMKYGHMQIGHFNETSVLVEVYFNNASLNGSSHRRLSRVVLRNSIQYKMLHNRFNGYCRCSEVALVDVRFSL